MVRQKNRWLLVQFDFENDIISSCTPASDTSRSAKSSKKRKLKQSNSNSSNLSESTAVSQSIQQLTSTDIYRALQDVVMQNFGLVGASTSELQVRLYDAKLRLAIIKTSRDKYPLVRSAITLMTQIKQGGDVLKVVPSTIAVSGSARTARSAAMNVIQTQFYGKEGLDSLGVNKGKPLAKRSKIALEKGVIELEDRLEKIDSGC